MANVASSLVVLGIERCADEFDERAPWSSPSLFFEPNAMFALDLRNPLWTFESGKALPLPPVEAFAAVFTFVPLCLFK